MLEVSKPLGQYSGEGLYCPKCDDILAWKGWNSSRIVNNGMGIEECNAMTPVCYHGTWANYSTGYLSQIILASVSVEHNNNWGWITHGENDTSLKSELKYLPQLTVIWNSSKRLEEVFDSIVKGARSV